MKTCWRICWLLATMAATGLGAESWPAAVARMPLPHPVTQLNRTNCVPLLLDAFRSNNMVKALVFMPGATDELNLFRRVRAEMTNTAPTLFDALTALTNQTPIRVTFQPPLLLLHTDEDPLDPLIHIRHEPTADRVKQRRFRPRALYNDRDWDYVQYDLRKALGIDLYPQRFSMDSWHFYRHTFAGWNLSGWEVLQAVALAGKSTITIEKNRLTFDGDPRFRAVPKLDHLPKDDL